MSELNDDTKPVKTRRTSTLKDVKESVREQSLEKLVSKLDEQEIGPRVLSIWTRGNANRANWLERQQEFLKDWDEFFESSAEGAFTTTSSLHIPMPFIVAKTLHARFLQAVVGVEPYFTLKPRREDAAARQEAVRDTMHYCLKDWANHNEGVVEVVDALLWKWVTVGSAVLKVKWDVEYTSFMDVVAEPIEGPLFFETINGIQTATPTLQLREKEVRKQKKVFEGPIFIDKNHEDVLIVGGAGDPQRADAVIDSFYMTASELWTLADRKVFRPDGVKEVIEGGDNPQTGTEGAAIKQQRTENAGQAEVDVGHDLARYQILEAYLKLDVDGSGINTDVVVWVHQKSGTILRATYLHRINKAGTRPFFKFDFHRRPGQDYGIGLIEMLHPLATELDAMHNIANDYGLLSTMPFGFYRPTSNLNNDALPLEPGVLIPVDDPQRDVFFPTLGARWSFPMQQESVLQSWIERLTGINDLSLGVLSGNQGATRTATGVRGLLSETSQNLDVLLRRWNFGWRKALKYTLHMLQQKIPPGLAFRVTGDTGKDYWRQIRGREDIAGDFDFELDPTTVTSNAAIQQEVAQNVLQFVLNPLLIQAGVVTTGNIWEASKNYLKNLGVKDFARFITKPPDHMHLLSPEDEVNRLLNGIPVPVTPEMDHQGFAEYWAEIEGNDELLGQFTPEQAIVVRNQAVKHRQMLEALRAQAAQVQNARQQRINATNPQSPISPPTGFTE